MRGYGGLGMWNLTRPVADAAQLLTTDYRGAAASVSGLVGLGRPDAVAHSQAALQSILAGEFEETRGQIHVVEDPG